MVRVAMLEQKKELEKKVEKFRLEEQLAVARVRDGVFPEIESDVKDNSSVRQEMPPEAFRVPVSSLSGLFYPTVSSTYTAPTVSSNTSTNVNLSVDFYDAPAIQTPPKPMQHPSLNSLAPELHSAEFQQDTEPVQRPKQEPLPSELYMADIQQSTRQFCDVLQQQNRLIELLAEQQQQSLLPSLTLTKFTGNPLEYSTFVTSFESQVEAKVSTNDVRLQYLDQYLHGELKDLIKGCLHLERHSGYLEAKRLLKETYGDPYKISNAYLKKINQWPCIRPRDEVALDRFSTFLSQCRSAMSILTFLSILDHPQNLQSVVTKLPFTLQDRWRRAANKKRVARGAIPSPSFADFVNFVNAEAGIATDPVFSQEALRRLEGSSDRPDRSGKGKGFGKSKTSGDHNRTSQQTSNHATEITAGQGTSS